MGAKTITELAVTSGLTSAALLEVSEISTTVTMTAATLSAQASDNSYNDSAAQFIVEGFALDDRVRVTGFTGNVANNILVGVVTAVTAGKLTIGGIDGDVIVDDAAGESVTIAKWVSRRATLSEVIALAPAASWKEKVRAATTAAGTLATSFENGDTIDGVVLATGDRILVKNQAAGAENGIYVVAASGAPTRADDANSGAEMVNATVKISEGTTLADSEWQCTTNAPITLNTTALVWSQPSPSGALTPSNNLSDVANPVTSGANIRPVECLMYAASDETTAITTGTGKITFRLPYAFTLTAVRASVGTAPTGAAILIDINEAGATILSTKLMIDATEKTSTTAATPYVLSDTSLADDAEMTVDFDQVGSTIAGAGVKIYLIGNRT